MAVLSLMIYGSCARNDNTPGSDVDVIALHNESYYKMNAYNKLNVVYYSKELLSERMNAGNLFCLHLVKEGKIIYDTERTLDNILKLFKYRNNYYSEIKEASDLGWTLIKFSHCFDNYYYLNKKIAWCLRTIIIGNSAQKRTPVFSKKSMISFVNDDSISSIINAKTSHKYSAENINSMIHFLSKFGEKKPKWLNDVNSLNDAQDYFEENTYGKFVTKTFKEAGYTL